MQARWVGAISVCAIAAYLVASASGGALGQASPNEGRARRIVEMFATVNWAIRNCNGEPGPTMGEFLDLVRQAASTIPDEAKRIVGEVPKTLDSQKRTAPDIVCRAIDDLYGPKGTGLPDLWRIKP